MFLIPLFYLIPSLFIAEATNRSENIRSQLTGGDELLCDLMRSIGIRATKLVSQGVRCKYVSILSFLSLPLHSQGSWQLHVT